MNKNDYFYRWGTKETIQNLVENGYNSAKDNWLWVLEGNETGGLYEYILGRKEVEEEACVVRIHKSVLQECNCYINPNGQIGHPNITEREYIRGMADIQMPEKGKTFDDSQYGYENYYSYIEAKLDDWCKKIGCDEKHECNAKCFYEDYIETFWNDECKIKPDNMEFACIKNPIEVASDSIKLKWVSNKKFQKD